MTLLRCSARLVTHTLELLGTKQRSVYLISCSHSQLLHTGNLPLVPKDKCPTPASRVAQQQTVRGFAAGAIDPPRAGPVLPDSVPRPVPGTEDFQAATDSSSDSDDEGDGSDVSTLVQGPAVPETEKDELLQKIQSSSKKHQRHILSQLLSGNELTGAPAMGEDESNAAINAARQKYSLKLVDVNSTNKGSPAGGVQSFSAMVVVGNHEGLLGHGTGKAAELVSAIRKASLRALNNLTFIPRYERFTILHPVDTKFGKCKLRMYPLASGGGIRANALLGDIASLAGINSIGIKAHGSRNARNSVKALFQAFEQLTTIEQKAKEMGMAAVEVIVGSRPKPKQRFKYASRLSK
ncbi:hypothetical protein WJX82_000655 [Trebouxia sp. C0006]